MSSQASPWSATVRAGTAGEMGGYTFIQRIVREIDGRNPSQLARRWIQMLTASIRAYDGRHLIGIGLLPFGGPFGPPTSLTSST